jgi:hypothetical protein
MRSYRVTWIIDVEAENHEDAARQALETMQDPNSTALVFDVREHHGSESVTVDLWEEEDDEAGQSTEA